MTVSVEKVLVPESKYKIKCPNFMKATSITVHNTYNDASAEQEIKYMIDNDKQISYHFAIDDKQVIQGIPLDRNAWAAGDGNGPGNRSSIHIEICYSKSGGKRYKSAEKLTIKFIAQLLHERKWGIEKVKKHQDWSGKLCPHRILSEKRWNSFLEEIEAALNKLNKPIVKKVSKDNTTLYHTILKGDTMWSLSKKYGTNIENLERLNPSIKPNNLKIGAKVKIK